jgi:hypothetical protein
MLTMPAACSASGISLPARAILSDGTGSRVNPVASVRFFWFIVGTSHGFSEKLGNVPKFPKYLGIFRKLKRIFGKLWKTLGKFGNAILGDIPASEELLRVILATEQGTSWTDVH